MSKIKIAWICHFTNEEIQSFLPLWRQRKEMAPWIPNLIKGFENHNEFELHIVSPHDFLKKNTSFKLRGVNYYFMKVGLPFYRRDWPGLVHLDAFTNYSRYKRNIELIIESIHPDIINLHGCENAYYSSSILNLANRFKVLISIQGFISEFKEHLNYFILPKRIIEIEEKILSGFKYFGGEGDSKNFITKYNGDFSFFKYYYPVNTELIFTLPDMNKKFDVIFYGRLNRLKGVVDFIKIVAYLKKKNPNIKACIIGRGNIRQLKKIASDLRCSQNIEFVGFLKNQRELFEYVKSSRILLVPTYYDRLPSTIREAMFLKVPVIAYNTGGIPTINSNEENILLIDRGDYFQMAKKVFEILKDGNKLINYSEKAFKYATREFSLESNMDRLLNAYKKILDI